MKKVFKKNQIVIAVLAVMIAAAGYLNYSGKIFGSKNKTADKWIGQCACSTGKSEPGAGAGKKQRNPAGDH